MTEDIIGQKVKKVLIVVELENGKCLVANPTEIGKIDDLVTLKDLQKLISNNEHPEDMKFMSPFVFALDLQDAGRRWIELIEDGYCYCHEDNHLREWEDKYECKCFNEGVKWCLETFLNLEDEDA